MQHEAQEDWCLWCGEELPPDRHWRKIFCCNDCKVLFHNRAKIDARQAAYLVPRDCARCGKTFTPRRRYAPTLCSEKCRHAVRREEIRAAQPDRPCAWCGTLFKPSGRTDTPGLYCGKTCAGLSRWRKHTPDN